MKKARLILTVYATDELLKNSKALEKMVRTSFAEDLEYILNQTTSHEGLAEHFEENENGEVLTKS